MASGSVWGVDIGKSSLKAVRMRRAKEDLEVQALYYQEYAVGEDGQVPAAESTNALEALIAKHPEIKKEAVHVALAGHTSFSRFIKIPAFDPRKLDEMARFEAQQQIPFPIADVNWDYAVVDRDYEAGEEREVGLFAIKKELVYAFMADLQLSGIEPRGITTTPLAVYNFVSADQALPDDQATIVLDIGWSTTDLVIIDGARYWIRNLALNGHELTKAIATRLKVGFQDAENQKRDAAAQKDSRKLYQATELVLRDFVAEIQRSIAFYKAQNKDRQIKIGQVLLLGNGAKLPNVRPFFQKELGLPVETVKRLERLTLDVDVEPDEVDLLTEHLPSFAVALGLGVQGCGEAPNEVNLLPEEVRQRQALDAKKPLVAIAVAALWLIAVASFMTADRSLKRTQGVLADATRNFKELDDLRHARDEAKEPIEATEAQVKRLVRYTAHRTRPAEVLARLMPLLPKGNDACEEPSPAQRKELETARAGAQAKITAIKKQLTEAQDKKNDQKIWIVEFNMKAGDDGVVRTTILCARKYIRNAAGVEDELATKTAIELGLLADIRKEFKTARFEGTAHKIYNLDQVAQPAAGGQFGSGGLPAYCAIAIAFDHPPAEATVAEAPR